MKVVEKFSVPEHWNVLFEESFHFHFELFAEETVALRALKALPAGLRSCDPAKTDTPDELQPALGSVSVVKDAGGCQFIQMRSLHSDLGDFHQTP